MYTLYHLGVSIAELQKKRESTIPLRRIGTAEEFGRAVAWLASPSASYITGHALIIDGGSTMSAL